MTKYHLKKKINLLAISIAALILFPAIISYTAEFPDKMQNHYRNKQLIYWEIRQITISPIFDEPETTLVRFYFKKPHNLFIATPDQNIYIRGDTIWVYLIKHKQIQKNISGYVLNPFDFIDSAQTIYQIIDSDNQKITLKSVDEMMEPDSLEIYYNKDGVITRVEYLDLNDNSVIFEVLDESFSTAIPEDNFLVNTPEGVEIIDINE